MKTKNTLLTICFFLIMLSSFAQKKNASISIIGQDSGIKQYHSSKELKEMQKGELLALYTERIKALTNILPYLAFASKPGVTMASLGIPDSNENKKALENQLKQTSEYTEETIEFQKVLLPYSDTKNLARAIFFYEEIMKSLHTYDEYN